MKTPLLFVLLFFTFQAFSQDNKFNFGIEYAPAFSNVTHQYWRNPYETGLWPVHNFFIRAGYRLSSKFDLTSGLGLMTAREFDYLELNGQLDIVSIESHRFHDYVVVPLGFKYKFGSFFINPDIGFGLNVSNSARSKFDFTDGTSASNKYKDRSPQVNEFTYPVSFGFGNEIKFKSCSVLMGIRGYYSLNGISSTQGLYERHYYVFGIFGGVSF